LPKPSCPTFAAAAIRLLILTGARLREILDAKWKHADFERGILFLPDSKTGPKPVYLGAAALAILASLPRLEGNPHIVAGMKDGAQRADLKKPWAAVTKAAGLEGLRIHDLRHSFASVGAGASLGLPIIGKLLGHTQAATTHRYAHLDADMTRCGGRPRPSARRSRQPWAVPRGTSCRWKRAWARLIPESRRLSPSAERPGRRVMTDEEKPGDDVSPDNHRVKIKSIGEALGYLV
jgi:hypothetical protein